MQQGCSSLLSDPKMAIHKRHEWDLSPAQAIQLQRDLARQIDLKPLGEKPRFVAGLDCALSKDKQRIFGVAAVFSFPELKLLETVSAESPLVFPYVPGLLSFRELPVCLKAAAKLKTVPDLWLIDGQGIAHPRRLGLASHLGLFLNSPTIGCAKSRLIGSFDKPESEKGGRSWLYDRDEVIGTVVRTRTNVKPLFISPGHLCNFNDAIKYTLACTTKYRLPEPTRIAHQTVSKIKTGDINNRL
jgi:deoxyribonuclease V